jgi:hypothetical protein
MAVCIGTPLSLHRTDVRKKPNRDCQRDKQQSDGRICGDDVRPKKGEPQKRQDKESERRDPTRQPHPMSHAASAASMVNGRLEENEPARYFFPQFGHEAL